MENHSDAFSTFQQQYKHLVEELEDEHVCPLEQFVINLEKELAKYREKGDEIILYLDANEDTRKDHALSQAAEQGRLREVLLE